MKGRKSHNLVKNTYEAFRSQIDRLHKLKSKKKKKKDEVKNNEVRNSVAKSILQFSIIYAMFLQ